MFYTSGPKHICQIPKGFRDIRHLISAQFTIVSQKNRNKIICSALNFLLLYIFFQNFSFTVSTFLEFLSLTFNFDIYKDLGNLSRIKTLEK